MCFNFRSIEKMNHVHEYSFQVTGHSSDCVREYKRTSIAMKRKISNIISLQSDATMKTETAEIESTMGSCLTEKNSSEDSGKSKRQKLLRLNCGDLSLDLHF